MGPKTKFKLKQTLDVEDVFCIACRCIYLRPVTMPCSHTLCLECFKNMVNITAYQCPICRMRISNWLRKYKHDWDSMVNEELWEAVQQQYPVEVQKRLNDEDDGLEERIVNQGFTRVIIKEGEIKKEFDDMIMNFNQEHEEIEQHNFEVAKQLQKEEESIIQARNVLNEELIKDDVKLASSIQKKIMEELQQEQILLNESDMNVALKLQNKMLSELNKAEKPNITIDSKKTQSKKGPLDKIFSKLTPTHSETKFGNKENIYLCCPSSPSTSSSFNSDLCTSSSIADSSKISVDEDFSESCTCGRLQDLNSAKPPCQFCIAQIELLNKLLTQQKNDLLMAKDLDKKYKTENFEDYNLRKRSNPTQTVIKKKIRKLSKGQLTLKQVLG